MVYYKKRQEEGFQTLKSILQDKITSDTIQDCVKRMEEVFEWYTIIDLNWDIILLKIKERDGASLEEYLSSLTALVESYAE